MFLAIKCTCVIIKKLTGTFYSTKDIKNVTTYIIALNPKPELTSQYHRRSSSSSKLYSNV